MSNDNKTLADVQPGGRVRLATVLYDRAHDLLADAYNAGTHGIGYSQQAMELHDAIIPAQPSPVHQIDAETLWWLQDAINTMAEGGNQSHVRFLQSLHDSLAAQPSPGGQDASFPWENFPAYLIDKCEGDTISEEGLQEALAAMAKDERYCLAALQPVGEPVTVEAVATVRRNGDGDRYIDWLTEGGIADLEVGDMLMVSDRAITDEDGSGEVYTAPPGGTE